MTRPASLWLNITSGQGPAECERAVALLMRAYSFEAGKQGVVLELLDAVPSRWPDAYLSMLLRVEGKFAREFLAGRCGTVKWIARSPFRSDYGRKNWFVGVEQLRVPADHETAWCAGEISFEAFRASGPGGQNVNKTSSAVRVKHLPTGLIAVAREERTQLGNRRLALARLAEQLKERNTAARLSVEHDRWQQHWTLERGNPVRVYRGERFELCWAEGQPATSW